MSSKDKIWVEAIGSSGSIFVLRMNEGPDSQNRVNPNFITKFNAVLDKIENISDLKVLIITGEGKFFSNGLDLDYLSKNAQHVVPFMQSVWKLLARILVLPFPTIAAINGHAFGLGIFIALACDYRVMRSDRGYVCFPEVSLGLTLGEGLAALAKTKLSANALRTGVLGGKRWNAEECIKDGVIDLITGQDCLHDAVKFGTPLIEVSMSKENMYNLKKELYGITYNTLSTAIPVLALPSKL